MIKNLIDSLNPAQREAVTAPLCNQLILAGAGSGKTRVLTARIAWLVREAGLTPYHILAVTFTNKATNEMRERIQELLGDNARRMWVDTFHSFAHRLLRIHWREANLPEHFNILDAEDQQRLLRRIIQFLNIDDERWTPKKAQWFINQKKDEGLLPQHLSHEGNYETRNYIRIYQAYEEACTRAGAVDFAGLLQKLQTLWLSHPDILKHYQARFRYVLVDEFQDTNAIQYALIKLLAGPLTYLMVVGDDDQSIYGWRGAKVENILQFNQDFPACQTVRLEQNYRSTHTILAAANAVISHNVSRLGKNLWTAGQTGSPIIVYAGFNEADEARFIIQRIRELQQNSIQLSEIAILYRSNAQSRILEENLLQANIFYRVYGGLRFFDRAEIRDALSYLRLIVNPHDDTALERIINTPTRGLGERTLEIIRQLAQSKNFSLWTAIQEIVSTEGLKARALSALKYFIQLIETLSEDTLDLPLQEQVEYVIQNSGLIDHFKKEKGEKGHARLDNLAELVNAARDFSVENHLENLAPLSAFLASSALESTEGNSENAHAVQLMTLHSAKGLEFPIVFLCGCEEGLFPHHMSKNDPNGIEEERRLCYVGMTRAMQQLYLTWAETRRLHGREISNIRSRFLKEIPSQYLQEARITTRVSMPAHPQNQQKIPFLKIGQHVRHKKFGTGIVLQSEGLGEHARVQVKFDEDGVKWLIANYVET